MTAWNPSIYQAPSLPSRQPSTDQDMYSSYTSPHPRENPKVTWNEMVDSGASDTMVRSSSRKWGPKTRMSRLMHGATQHPLAPWPVVADFEPSSGGRDTRGAVRLGAGQHFGFLCQESLHGRAPSAGLAAVSRAPCPAPLLPPAARRPQRHWRPRADGRRRHGCRSNHCAAQPTNRRWLSSDAEARQNGGAVGKLAASLVPTDEALCSLLLLYTAGRRLRSLHLRVYSCLARSGPDSGAVLALQHPKSPPCRLPCRDLNTSRTV